PRPLRAHLHPSTTLAPLRPRRPPKRNRDKTLPRRCRSRIPSTRTQQSISNPHRVQTDIAVIVRVHERRHNVRQGRESHQRIERLVVIPHPKTNRARRVTTGRVYYHALKLRPLVPKTVSKDHLNAGLRTRRPHRISPPRMIHTALDLIPPRRSHSASRRSNPRPPRKASRNLTIHRHRLHVRANIDTVDQDSPRDVVHVRRRDPTDLHSPHLRHGKRRALQSEAVMSGYQAPRQAMHNSPSSTPAGRIIGQMISERHGEPSGLLRPNLQRDRSRARRGSERHMTAREPRRAREARRGSRNVVARHRTPHHRELRIPRNSAATHPRRNRDRPRRNRDAVKPRPIPIREREVIPRRRNSLHMNTRLDLH